MKRSDFGELVAKFLEVCGVHKIVLWLFDFCPRFGELILGTMAIRYAWLVGHPTLSPVLHDAVVADTLSRVLQVAAPLIYWVTVMALIGGWQIFALIRDAFVGQDSIPLRKKADSWACGMWALIAFSFWRNGEPPILWATFAMFSLWSYFCVMLLHRQKLVMDSIQEGGSPHA